ncbi:unnamed protein product [Pocillopora meandrina]|uniref:Endonuclease/exonuclease/phosphatase domain-containing protein n=1 Tax=Pocillopora meandrina TaxID=46732 RepID=A0AAU9WSN2_9CNID|nr:unnamed protein product [Pocillopora meandrina]
MLYDHARSGRSGGGTALLCRDSISVTRIAAGEKKSFEFSEWIILEPLLITGDFNIHVDVVGDPVRANSMLLRQLTNRGEHWI